MLLISKGFTPDSIFDRDRFTADKPLGQKPKGWLDSLSEAEDNGFQVVSDCGPRNATEEAGVPRIKNPLEFDLKPNSSLLATQAFNRKGHLLMHWSHD